VRPFVFILVAIAVTAAACNSGSSDSSAEQQRGPTQETTPQPTVSGHHFTKSELAHIVLQPSDAPPGMRYTRRESGPKTLDDLGFVLKADLKEINSLRIRGIRDVIFDSSNGRSRLSSRAWLFAQPKGASAWLEKSRNDAINFALEPLDSPSLADASWAARGSLTGVNVLTYAFRSENVVVTVSMLAPESTAATDSTALAAAHRAVDRLQAS